MDCLQCPRPRPLPVSVVNTITVAILKCLVASTLAQYAGYYGHNFNPYAYPYPYAYYPLRRPLIVPPLLDSQKAAPPFEKILSQQIYLPPDVYRGYAYQTAYGDGGGTKVVFVRGPDANAILEQSIRTFSISPVLPLSVTTTSNVLEITRNNTTKTDEKSKQTKTTEQKHKTASDAKIKAKTENKATNKDAEVSTTTITPVIPPSHSTVTPFTVTPGVFYYPLQLRPPGYVNSLAPAVPYFQHSLFNPPFDFFGGLGLPPLFAAFDASAENREISPNSLNIPLFHTPGFFSESSGSNDTSSPSASVPNSPSDKASSASSQPTDPQSGSGSSSDNGASIDEESSSSEEASTESNNSDESSSSETSSSNTTSESNESSNSIEENASTSEAASDTEKSKDTGSASDGSGKSSIDTSSTNN